MSPSAAERRDGEDGPVDDDLDALGYGDAVAELEAILAAIEDDAIDIDQLSRQVRRAAALIRLCETRIAGARIEVERVVADLAAGLDGAASTRRGDAGDLDDNDDGNGDEEDDGDHDDADADDSEPSIDG